MVAMKHGELLDEPILLFFGAAFVAQASQGLAHDFSRQKATLLSHEDSKDETPMDKCLRAVQAVGGVIGKQHDALAAIPALEFFLSNAMFFQMGFTFLLMKFTKKINYEGHKAQSPQCD